MNMRILVQSLELVHKARQVMCACIWVLGMQGLKDPWGWLARQFSQTTESQISQETLFQKETDKDKYGWLLRSTSEVDLWPLHQ